MFGKLKTAINLIKSLYLIPIINNNQVQIENKIDSILKYIGNKSFHDEIDTEKSSKIQRNLLKLERVKSEDLITLNNGGKAVIVPLDHESVIMPRGEGFVYHEIEKRFERDSASITAHLDLLRTYLDHSALDSVPQQEESASMPYWNNGYFSRNDARFAFATVAALRPKNILEIGSGNSTRFMRLAIETVHSNTKLVSIDPAPRIGIEEVVDANIRKSVLEVALEEFDILECGDILFHDGSHLTLNGTDTVRLFLEILPRLKPGVIVHIHDINLPREYPKSFDGRGYSEQYMLGATLLFGDEWEVLAPLAYISGNLGLKEGGLSFWMRKR